MARYASETTVTSDKTRIEIEKTLTRYGATAFIYGWEGSRARIQFKAQGRYIRFDLPLPDRQARQFTHTPEKGLLRSTEQAEAAYEQAVRQRWRALLLIVKAKLEAIEAGIVTFDDEFLSAMVLPDNSTVGQWIKPQLALAYDRGDMPKMLPGPAGEGK